MLSFVANSFAAKVLVIVNKFILFNFCSLIEAVTKTRRGGIIKNIGGYA